MNAFEPSDFKQRLEALLGSRGRLRTGVPGSQLTTFGLGGPLSWLIEPGALEPLEAVIKYLAESGRPCRILGAGSNLLIADQGVAEPVIVLGKPFSTWRELNPHQSFSSQVRSLIGGLGTETANAVAFNTVARIPEQGANLSIIAGGAVSLMSLSRITAGLGLAGLEFAAGIPASVGGAVFMNAGAHGGSIGEVAGRIAAVDPHGTLQIIERSELPFSYRHSGLQPGWIVAAVEFILTAGLIDEVQARRAACLEYRKKTQPLHLPSAGSVFRNPAGGRTAAELLDQLGFRGKSCGAISFSAQHANWLVKNPQPPGAPAASSADALLLIAEARAAIEQQFGISLHPEIICWQ